MGRQNWQDETANLDDMIRGSLDSSIEDKILILLFASYEKKMCLAIPARVVAVDDSMAKVDFGSGVTREVNIMLVDVKIGEYVLVHSGYAIQVIDKKAAQETLELWNQILNQV